MKNRTMGRRLTAAMAFSVVATLSAGTAGAQQILDSYTAYIGPADLLNSSGARLYDAAAVIRQDRANYHRFEIRDPEDEWDSFFENPRNRELLESWVRAGRMDRYVSDRILAGGALIHVQIWGYGDSGEYVSIVVY